MAKKKNVRDPTPEQYDVEVICKTRTTEDKKWEYFIKWGGYPESDNSWEPEANLTGCHRMLRDFWRCVAGQAKQSQAETLPFGFEVVPPKDWIDKSIEEYRINTSRKNEAKQKKEVEHQKNSKYNRRSRSAIMVDSEDNMEDIKPFKENVKSTTITIPQRLSPIAMPPEDPISEDDLPLDAMSETSYSDLDDAPLSQIQAQRKSPQTGKRKRSEEDIRENHVKHPFSPPVATDEQIQDTPPINGPSQGVSDKSAPDVPDVSNIPAHRKRKLYPRVQAIEITKGYQAISTKARVARSGSGSKPTTIDKTSLPSPVSPQIDADQWLREKFPSPVAASPTVQTPTHGTLPSFGKIWKWSGQLYLNDNESSADGPATRIGNVKMVEHVPGETQPSDLSMNWLLPPQRNTLCFRHTYSLPTLPAASDNFRFSHFTRLIADPPTTGPIPNSSSNTKAEGETLFSSLVTFMEKNLLYSTMPIMIEERKVATMFVMPAPVRAIWDIVKLPEKLRNINATPSLIIAMGIQLYEPPKGEYVNEDNLRKLKDYDPSSSYLFSFSDFGRAAMRLEFPEDLVKSLVKKLSNRAYSIFNGSSTAEDPYTKALNFVVSTIPGAQNTPVFLGEARCVFIHVGAWGMLHKLLGLVDRRLRRVDVQFFTYGADPTVERRFWGIQEIFLVGGIVTFTSQAILEKPKDVLDLIEKLHQQAIWGCYIHPAVISMLVKILRGNGLVTETNVDNIFNALSSLTGILRAIEKEQVELMWHPPSPFQWQASSPSPSLVKDLKLEKVKWDGQQNMLSRLRGTALTNECETLFPAANRTEKDVENLLVDDMVVMQSEYRKEYRRFVIITGSETTSNTSKEAANVSSSSCEVKDMFEFTHVGQFEVDISKQNNRCELK